MHAFDVLGDPVRRRILELLASGEHTSGEVVEVVGGEFGISQPAVSQHLRVLKEAGLVSDHADGTRRIYQIRQQGVQAIHGYLDQMWGQAMAAFQAEARRTAGKAPAGPPRRREQIGNHRQQEEP